MDTELNYQPLQAGEIRLMVLLPGKENDRISVKLVTTKLQADAMGAVATYEALSYQWGPPSPVEIINVNGRYEVIRYNLYLALNALRDEQFPRCLWVDALCIDQGNHLERGSQVSIMSKIFRQATKVLVWLGEASDGSDVLFELMAKVEGRLDRLDSLITIWRQAGIDVTGLTKDKIQAAFLAISRRSYWTRLWIIQEVLSASSIDLLCGSKTLPWAFFSSGLEAIGNLKASPNFESCALTPAYAIAAKQSYNCQAYPIEDLLHLCDRCRSKCEDVRDKVYGLVSIAKDFTIKVDYTKTTTELCLDIFKNFNNESVMENTRYKGAGRDETVFRAFQRLLMNPFWDPVELCSPAMDESVMCTWTGFHRPCDVLIRLSGKIMKVGPLIGPPGPEMVITESSLFEHKPKKLSGNTLVTKSFMVRSLSSLSAQEFHETAAIQETYTRLGGDEEYVKTDGPCGIAKSDGRVRTFWTSGNEHGIASSEIRESDFIYNVDFSKDLIVIRIESDSRFVLIGRAICFYNEPWRRRTPDSPVVGIKRPPLKCKFDLKTLFLLNR